MPQQRPRGSLGVARIGKRAAFQLIEVPVRGEEPVTALIPGDDSRGPVLYFDDVCFGHVSSFTGQAGAPVLLGQGYLELNRFSDRRRWLPRSSAASCTDVHM